MHVAFDVRTIQAGYGGDRIYLENLIRHLDRLPEIAAISLYTEPRLGDRIPLPDYGKVRRQALAASRGWLWTPLAVPRQLRRDAASIFHAPHLVPPFPPCPTVVTIHDAIQLVFAECDRSSPRARVDRALRGLSARRAAAIITDSAHSRGDIARLMHVPAEKIHVIPLAAAEHFTPGDRAEARARVRAVVGVQPPYVLCVGWASPHKNVPRVLNAVAAIRQAGGGDVAVVVAGNSGQHTVEELRAQFPRLDGRLYFTGWVSKPDLVALYRGAALLAFPSLYEGFGLPVLEAMACGTPVVTANTTSLPEVAGDAALMVDPTDDAALVEAVGRVLTDSALAASLTERGLRRAAEFSWDHTARATCAVYTKLLA